MSAWDYFADSGHEFINRWIVLLCQNNSVEEDTNNKPATNVGIKAHIKDKQKQIKQRFKSLLKKKLSKIILNWYIVY